MSVKHLYLIAVAGILGCAPAGGTSNTPGAASVPRKAGYLTAGEIAEAKADAGSAYDAILRLRPNWLAARGPTSSTPQASGDFATVFVDGQRYGGVESLRNIQAFDVADIRYYDITQAGATFGIQGGGAGVIEVRIRTR
jgi:hypothetical protein